MADRRGLKATTRGVDTAIRFIALGAAVAALAIIWTALHGAAAWRGDPDPTKHPITLILDLITGRGEVAWSTEATIIAVGASAALILLAAVIVLVFRRRRRTRRRSDNAAKVMADGRDLTHLGRKGARAKATRLGAPAGAAPGVPLGKSVRYKSWLYSSWEDMIVVVAGPRTMKSTAYAVPAIMAAPGAVLATSNKRDVVDATRGPRTELGEIWIFDPQGVATAPADWWWNPLTYIAPFDPATGRAQRDPHTGWVLAREDRAEKLAGQFVASSIPAGAKTDAYFDGEAENLIGLLLLAAACGDLPLTTVYSWLTAAIDETPIDLLDANGFTLQRESLASLVRLPDKQREGVYGTARARMGFLRNRNMVAWVTPPTHATRRQFHPLRFADSTDTLYPLSREGEGSAGPLVAALTVAVVDALEERATASRGGRLQVPFLAVLDEAANICKFRNLDSYYSHFGSRGIIIMTILQNWAQGEDVWGVKGMEKLWSAANVKVYGGGVDDDKFLRRLSDLIGAHDYVDHSESYGRGRNGRSTSSSVKERTILTIGELRELTSADKTGRGGRAVMFASGTPAVLVEPQPWFIGPHAATLNASLAMHDPTRGLEPPVDETQRLSRRLIGGDRA